MTSPRTEYRSSVISYGTHTLNADSVYCSSMYTHCISVDMLFVMNTQQLYIAALIVQYNYTYFMKVFVIKALGSQGDPACMERDKQR